MVALSLCLAACSSDDEPSYSTAAVTNSELMGILKGKGYQFNEQGNLLLDDKANQTTSLDLSGTNISVDALAELTILPNLTDVSLANNGYGPVFDVTKLPTQITGLDLRGNEVYDFEGLVSVNVVNDERETTVLHNFTKLYLPESAKYNVEDLMPYYEKAGSTTDMQMVNASGTLEKYNTLREIPDEYFRAYLKTTFSSVFASDTQIDISKPLSNAQQGENLMMNAMVLYSDADKINSIEGAEYFINNPYYKSFVVGINCVNKCSLNYIMPRNNIKGLILYNISTSETIDLSQATNLSNFQMTNNEGIKSIDLTNTAFANQETTDFDVLVSNGLALTNCENLSELKFNQSCKGITAMLTCSQLPALKTLDISFIVGIEELTLSNMSECAITYPMDKLTYQFDNADKVLNELSKSNRVIFYVSDEIKEMQSTQDFITKFKTSLRVRSAS